MANRKSGRPISKKYRGYYVEKGKYQGIICGYNTQTNFILMAITGDTLGFRHLDTKVNIIDEKYWNHPKGFHIITEADILNSIQTIL